VSRVLRPARHIIGHFGDGSFQVITCSGTDNSKQTGESTPKTHTRKHRASCNSQRHLLKITWQVDMASSIRVQILKQLQHTVWQQITWTCTLAILSVYEYTLHTTLCLLLTYLLFQNHCSYTKYGMDSSL